MKKNMNVLNENATHSKNRNDDQIALLISGNEGKKRDENLGCNADSLPFLKQFDRTRKNLTEHFQLDNILKMKGFHQKTIDAFDYYMAHDKKLTLYTEKISTLFNIAFGLQFNIRIFQRAPAYQRDPLCMRAVTSDFEDIVLELWSTLDSAFELFPENSWIIEKKKEADFHFGNRKERTPEV